MGIVPAGTPCWADLAAPDLDDARRFYPELFGWTGRIAPEPEANGYTDFLRHGQAVAGAGLPAISEQVPIWSIYVAADDTDLVAARVEEAGGQLVVPPFDVFDRGRMAVLSDPAGATLCVWQPLGMPGGEVFGVPGAMSWTELVTPDPEGAKVFYELVFGWQPDEPPTGPAGHTGWRLGSQIVAGMTTPLGDYPAGAPAYWSVYFGVADVDATAARAAALGGAILVPPRDTAAGRCTALRDPQGALFHAITPP